MKMKMFDISGRKPRQMWEKNGDVDISRDNMERAVATAKQGEGERLNSLVGTLCPLRGDSRRSCRSINRKSLETVDSNQMSSSTREFANSVQYNMFGRIQYSNSKCGSCGK